MIMAAWLHPEAVEQSQVGVGTHPQRAARITHEVERRRWIERGVGGGVEPDLADAVGGERPVAGVVGISTRRIVAAHRVVARRVFTTERVADLLRGGHTVADEPGADTAATAATDASGVDTRGQET